MKLCEPTQRDDGLWYCDACGWGPERTKFVKLCGVKQYTGAEAEAITKRFGIELGYATNERRGPAQENGPAPKPQPSLPPPEERPLLQPINQEQAERLKREAKARKEAFKQRVLDEALAKYTGASGQRTPDDMRQMIETWQLGCGEPAAIEIPAYAARLLRKGSTLDARSAVWEIVNAQWKDDPAIRTKQEIAEILRRWPPKCGRPEKVRKYADYALNRHAWITPDWGKEPDAKLWSPVVESSTDLVD